MCPTDALAPAERSLAILLDRCLRCGRCAAACPTEALAVEGFPEIAATATRIECGRVPPELRAPGTAVVPCLGGVRAGALRAHLARAEAAVATLVDRGWCADCPAGGTAEPWAAVVDRLDRELEELGSARRVEVAREPLPPALAGPPPAPPRTLDATVGRRAFLRGAAEVVERVGSRRIAVRGEGPPQRVETAALRERAASLAALAGGDGLPAALFPVLAIAETCRDSRLCAASCPTGALELELELDEETSVLVFEPVLCIGCRRCLEVCPTGSPSLSPAGEEGRVERRVLRRRATARCGECGAVYGPRSSSGRCPACEKDEELARRVHRWLRERDSSGLFEG